MFRLEPVHHCHVFVEDGLDVGIADDVRVTKLDHGNIDLVGDRAIECGSEVLELAEGVSVHPHMGVGKDATDGRWQDSGLHDFGDAAAQRRIGRFDAGDHIRSHRLMPEEDSGAGEGLQFVTGRIVDDNRCGHVAPLSKPYRAPGHANGDDQDPQQHQLYRSTVHGLLLEGRPISQGRARAPPFSPLFRWRSAVELVRSALRREPCVWPAGYGSAAALLSR